MSEMMVVHKEMRTSEGNINSNIPINQDSISKQINNDSLKMIQRPIDVKIKEPIQSEPHQVLILNKSRSTVIENIAT